MALRKIVFQDLSFHVPCIEKSSAAVGCKSIKCVYSQHKFCERKSKLRDVLHRAVAMEKARMIKKLHRESDSMMHYLKFAVVGRITIFEFQTHSQSHYFSLLESTEFMPRS